MRALVLATAWGTGCEGLVGDDAVINGAPGDGGRVVASDGGAVAGGGSVVGGGGGGGAGDRDVVLDGGGHDSGPSPWVDLVTHIAINAEAEITKDEKVPATLEIRRYDDRSLVADGIHVGIKIRGHVSVRWPKKNYGLEVWDASGKDSKYDFLGMGAEEDWALHGPYADRSLLHNVVINHLSNQIGRYAPETRLTSLAIRTPGQSAYKELGVYALMEQIRFSKDRLSVDKTSPDGSKKAFLMQIDWTDDDKSYRATAKNTPIFFVYPPDKSRTAADEDTALAVINTFEASLDRPEQALNSIDQKAAADYFILTELARNPDGYHVSYYLHIPIDGLITFGPIWDFDLAFGISEWGDGTQVEGWQYELKDGRYFRQLLQVSSFRQLIKARWQQLRQTELSDTAFENVVRTYVKRLGPNIIAANNTLWPFSAQIFLLSPKMTVYTEYNQVIEYMIDYGQSRMQWIDKQVQSW